MRTNPVPNTFVILSFSSVSTKSFKNWLGFLALVERSRGSIGTASFFILTFFGGFGFLASVSLSSITFNFYAL